MDLRREIGQRNTNFREKFPNVEQYSSIVSYVATKPAAVAAATGRKKTGARAARGGAPAADLFHYFIRLNIHDGRARW